MEYMVLPIALGLAGFFMPLFFTRRRRRMCKHQWFNMRVIETGEYARICEKCHKLERHLS